MLAAAITFHRFLPRDRFRALLLFRFVGALRRSELVALRVEDVAIVAGGLRLRVVRGKTEQAGQGAEIGLTRRGCPAHPAPGPMRNAG
jgi:integrase